MAKSQGKTAKIKKISKDTAKDTKKPLKSTQKTRITTNKEIAKNATENERKTRLKLDEKQKGLFIKQEKRKLIALLAELPDIKLKAVESLIDRCSYGMATLRQLEEFINENGIIDEMEQGSYKILRESPAMRSYQGLLPKCAAIYKQLIDMLPTKGAGEIDDDFDEFRRNK